MKVHFFTKAHPPHNQNSSIYILACQKISLLYVKCCLVPFCSKSGTIRFQFRVQIVFFFLIIRYSFGDN